MPYSVLEARTKDEFETDDLSPSRERRHMQERKREKERRGENGRKGGKRATRRESVTGERGKKEIIRTRRGEERAFGKTPLVDRALDDCLAFRFFRGGRRGRGGITRFGNHLVRRRSTGDASFQTRFLFSPFSSLRRRRRRCRCRCRCRCRRRRRLVPPLLRALSP